MGRRADAVLMDHGSSVTEPYMDHRRGPPSTPCCTGVRAPGREDGGHRRRGRHEGRPVHPGVNKDDVGPGAARATGEEACGARGAPHPGHGRAAPDAPTYSVSTTAGRRTRGRLTTGFKRPQLDRRVHEVAGAPRPRPATRVSMKLRTDRLRNLPFRVTSPIRAEGEGWTTACGIPSMPASSGLHHVLVAHGDAHTNGHVPLGHLHDIHLQGHVVG